VKGVCLELVWGERQGGGPGGVGTVASTVGGWGRLETAAADSAGGKVMGCRRVSGWREEAGSRGSCGAVCCN